MAGLPRGHTGWSPRHRGLLECLCPGGQGTQLDGLAKGTCPALQCSHVAESFDGTLPDGHGVLGEEWGVEGSDSWWIWSRDGAFRRPNI